MATKHHIHFYPVGNGDTCQIVTANGQRILFDYCHRRCAEDEEDERIDLKARLKSELDDAGRDDFDMVAFTHADLDHIANSTDFFELEHSKAYQGGGRIKIRELWLPAAMLLEDVEKGDERAEFALWKKEGRHRLLEGKGIRVFSQPQALMDWLVPKLRERNEGPTARDHLFVDAGTVVNSFDLNRDGIEFFCHSPFIKHCDEGDIIRNDASLVFNVRFQTTGGTYDFLQVGDSTASVLDDIVTTTEYHGRGDRLNWNLFNVPHHCSYKALNETDKGDNETVPTPLVKSLLLRGQRGAYAVSSSWQIKDDREAYNQDQPPHVQARNCYRSHLAQVRGREFLVTMEESKRRDPSPITFEIDAGGVCWIKAVAGASAILTSRPHRAGLSSLPTRVG